MKNILRKNSNFQYLLKTLIYVFQLCFGVLPEIEPNTTICFDSPFVRNQKALKRAVFNFELSKRGARCEQI
jgi:hypothetical protein